MFAAERELNHERMSAREGMKPLLDKLGRGERLSVEERTDLDARNSRISEIEAELRTYESARAQAAAVAEIADATPEARTVEESREERARRQTTEWLRYGTVGSELRAAPEAGTPQAVGSGPAGGYLVPPGWWQNLQIALKVYGGIANDFKQLETESGQPMQWATNDPTSTIGQLVSENTQVQEQDYTFGTASLGAYMYTSGAQLVSYQLANDSAFDIDSFVRDRVGESLGRAKAAVAVSGDGSAKPTGIIPALNAASRFVSLTAATAVNVPGAATQTELGANVLSAATLRQMVAAVDPAYRSQGASFYMNDAQLLGLRGLADSNGRPLVNLQDGITPGAPTTLWGHPVVVDNNLPNLAASTTGGPIFGHLQSAMVCRTVAQSGLLRLTERWADYLQVGFIGYMRFDIKANDTRAAVTVKTAAT